MKRKEPYQTKNSFSLVKSHYCRLAWADALLASPTLLQAQKKSSDSTTSILIFPSPHNSMSFSRNIGPLFYIKMELSFCENNDGGI